MPCRTVSRLNLGFLDVSLLALAYTPTYVFTARETKRVVWCGVQDDMAARLRSVLSLAGIPQEGFPVKVRLVLRFVWCPFGSVRFVLSCS